MRLAVGWPTSNSVVRECGHFLTGLPALWEVRSIRRFHRSCLLLGPWDNDADEDDHGARLSGVLVWRSGAESVEVAFYFFAAARLRAKGVC